MIAALIMNMTFASINKQFVFGTDKRNEENEQQQQYTKTDQLNE